MPNESHSSDNIIYVGLSFAQIQAAITYNQAHAMDVLPAIEREIGRAPSPPGRGWWNVAAVECIANLQEAAGIVVDGRFGPRSRLSLCDRLRGYATDGLWPAPDADEREHWSTLCELVGYPLIEGRHTLLALRGVKPEAPFTRPHANRPAYDDTFVWLGLDGSLRRFVGATHPYQLEGENVPEEDIATIRAGRYRVRKTYEHEGQPALDLFNLDGTNLIPARFERARRIPTDTISELPTRNSQLNPQGLYSRGIMFHPGFDTKSDTGRPFSSQGSQTAPLPEILHLYEAGEFDYVLLDVVEALVKLGRIKSG
jgi:hypothetical protein